MGPHRGSELLQFTAMVEMLKFFCKGGRCRQKNTLCTGSGALYVHLFFKVQPHGHQNVSEDEIMACTIFQIFYGGQISLW